MAELQTYIFPAIQAFFLLIIAIARLIGFIRQRNFGFFATDDRVSGRRSGDWNPTGHYQLCDLPLARPSRI